MSNQPDQIEQAALCAVRDTIEQRIHAGCYQRLVLRDTDGWRKKNMSPLAREWGFNSLLGAIWLQFEWLVTMDGLRYCKAPGCNHHTSPYASPAKKTCDATCRKSLQRSKETD